MLNLLLKHHKVALASASPRRKEIFELLGLNALIIPSKIAEPIDHRPPWMLVQAHAAAKAKDVSKFLDEQTVIVAADTLVYVDSTVLGKPLNKPEAARYLRMLSGKEHNVYTGISVLWKNRQITRYAKSTVRFQILTEQEIKDYIETNEPMDKAGAYGIQGYGCQFISKISGCYFNVMGFPVNTFYQIIKEML